MRVLAIDTSLTACSVAILDGPDVLACQIVPMAKGQAERLVPLTQDCLHEAGLGPSEIDRIGVTCGPGAFTGIRIGLAFARSFALALNKPCLGFSTLEALARGARAGQGRTIAAISGAGSLYVAAYEGDTQIFAPHRFEDVGELDRLQGDWCVTGPAAEMVLVQRPEFNHVPQVLPDPVVLARMTQTAEPGLRHPTPLYLREVQAKRAEASSLRGSA